MGKENSSVALNLRRGNIGLVMVIVIAWLFHIYFFINEEFDISTFFPVVFLSPLALLIGVFRRCKYMLPIAVTFAFGNYFFLWLSSEIARFSRHFFIWKVQSFEFLLNMYGGWQWKSNPYGFGNGLTYKLFNGETCNIIPNEPSRDISTFCNYLGVIIDQYFMCFQLMQVALLVGVLVSFTWWSLKHNLAEEIKYFTTDMTLGKIIRINLLLILAFTISIPYWFFFAIA